MNTFNVPLRTIEFAVNVQYTHTGEIPRQLERASVTFNADGSLLIKNRAGAELRLDYDAAVGLALLLKAEVLKPVASPSFGFRASFTPVSP